MVHGQITDMELVKILVLYTLERIEKTVPTSRIYDLFLNSELVDYFTLAQAIESLKETGHIVVDEDSSVIVITRLGAEASRELYTRIPLYARERAVNGALDIFKQIELEAGVSTRTDYIDEKYTTTCIIKDGESVLMKIELTMPDREMGREAEKKFKESSSEIYRMVLEKLS